jgi:formate hydrogenlyase subunit 3/multisubunit Na+/H+ antiporter MnhD subunit
MVTPIMLIAAALGFAFILPVLNKFSKTAAKSLSVALLGGFLALSLVLFLQVLQTGRELVVQTAGFTAPFSINLAMGLMEVLGLLLINTLAIPALWFFLTKKETPWQGRELALFFTLLMGLNGLILTRDLFNIFVFMEVSSISLFGILAAGSDKRVFEGGFKYMIAGGLASAFYLIGIAFLYRETGTLNLDFMLHNPNTTGLYLPMLLLLAGILIELKPFPANGWALDSYQSADNGTGAVISGLNTTALLIVLLKLMPLFIKADQDFSQTIAVVGGLTFLISNLAGLRQKDTRRMLGYSSIGQTGLIMLVLSFDALLPTASGLALLLLANHAFSKTALFWLAKLLKSQRLRNCEKEGSLRENRLLLLGTAIGVIALSALPPFPGFWAKWDLLVHLQSIPQGGVWVPVILVGSLLEAVYLFRWYIKLQAEQGDNGQIFEAQIPEDFPEEKKEQPPAQKIKLNLAVLAPVLSLLLLTALGLFISTTQFMQLNPMILVPVAALLVFGLLDLLRLPLWLKTLLAMGGLGYYSYIIIPQLQGLNLIFGFIFLGGSAVQLFILLNRKKDRAAGLLPLLMGLIFSLGSLLIFRTKLGLFFSWEMMTLTSFLLISRGKQASGASLRYLIFSLAGAFLILGALTMEPTLDWPEFIANPSLIPGILLALGFLTKLGALGLHLWLPSAYAESEDDVTTFLSSVLSKAGLFMLFLTGGFFILPILPQASGWLGSIQISQLLGWIGVLTALVGALMALFQEDIKYTLAYSSMGQIGYMILAFGIFSHLGWVTSLYMAVTHLLFKGLLFLAIAGVIQRTKTRMMYQMGGLIKTMPFSFISVLMAIIALSGVPPLTGFGGKWLLYSSLLAKGWYLQAALAMFASGIAFLYLFRLIHSIFLGQPKPCVAHVKEAPIWGLIPQFVFMGLIMLFSMFPNLLIQPIQAAVEPFFPAAAEGVTWQGATVLSSLGYWNGSAVMYVTMGVFMVPLIWLLIMQGRAQRVKQFNIVYSAERPYKPETTHYAFNFFSHYKKALGFLTETRTDRFWSWITSAVDALAGAVRRIYSGNAQTYVLHILIFVLMLFALSGGMN